MKRSLLAFVVGLVFAAGLALGGMTDPLKVIGFLDVTGAWDPSLAFVMGGAILVYAPVHALVRGRKRPLWDLTFHLPARNDIDARLLVGAGLFGAGWGLGGYCPGPALVSAATFAPATLVFVAAMLAGMWLFSWRTR